MELASPCFERMELPALPFEELVFDDNDNIIKAPAPPTDDVDLGFHDNDTDGTTVSDIDIGDFKSVSIQPLFLGLL